MYLPDCSISHHLFLDDINVGCWSFYNCAVIQRLITMSNSSLLMILYSFHFYLFCFQFSIVLFSSTGFPLEWYFGFLPYSCFSCQCLTLRSASQLMVLNTIPMCSSQYERMFNTSRVPGVETGRASLSPASIAVNPLLDASERLLWAYNA